MDSYLITGIIIGLLFGMPIGAVGAITVQKTVQYGPRIGLVSGMGSSVADCLYACIGTFSLNFISVYLFENQLYINIIGGTIIVFMGIKLVMKQDEVMITQSQISDGVKVFFTSFTVAITNPATVLTFLFAFSYFGISGKMELNEGFQLILGVFIGTLFWWWALVGIISKLRRKMNTNAYKKLNKIFGVVMLVFGLVIFIKIGI